MPRNSATRRPRRTLSEDESFSGSSRPNTLDFPNARTQSAEVTELSMPPESATTTPRLRARRTNSSRPLQILSTAAALSKPRMMSFRMSVIVSVSAKAGTPAHEALVNEQRRKHAHESHVVRETDRAPGPALLEQPPRSRHFEITRIAQILRGEQRLHVVERLPVLEEGRVVRRAVRLLAPLGDLRRQQLARRCTQHGLLVQATQFVIGRQAVRELDDAMIEERHAPFHGIRHGH